MSENIEKKRGSYLNTMQKEELIQFAEDNYSVLYGRKSGPDDDVIKQNLWLLISLKLNAIGPSKDVEGWKRCVTTLKAATKLKLEKGKELTDIELKIVKMSGIEALVVNSQISRIKQTKKDKIRSLSVNSVIDKQPNRSDQHEHPETFINPESQVEPSLNCSSSLDSLANIPHQHLLSIRESESVVSSGKEKLISPQMTQTHLAFPGQIVKEPTRTKTKTQQNIGGSNATMAQKEELIKQIGANYSALFGRISTKLNAQILKEKLWKLITRKLNTIGPNKDVKGWQNCYSYLKLKTKEKLTMTRHHKNLTGQQPNNIILKPFENGIVAMCGEELLDGCSKLLEIGLKEDILNETSDSSKTNKIAIPSVRAPHIAASSTNTLSQLPVENQVLSSNDNNTQCVESLRGHHRVGVPSTITSSMTLPLLPERRKNEVAIEDDRINAIEDDPIDAPIDTIEDNQIDEIENSFYDLGNDLPFTDACATDMIYAPETSHELHEEGRDLASTSLTAIYGHYRRVLPEVLLSVQNIQPTTQSDARASTITPTFSDSQQQDEDEDPDNIEIRVIQDPPPQRRGVEINLNRYADFDNDEQSRYNEEQYRDALRDTDGDHENQREPNLENEQNGSSPRRNKLSVPLSVMAVESLKLQRQQNALLTEMVFLLRNNFRNGN